jgi:hypothetical protein
MSEFNPEPLDHYSYRQPLKIRQCDSHLYAGLQPVLAMCMFAHVHLRQGTNVNNVPQTVNEVDFSLIVACATNLNLVL